MAHQAKRPYAGSQPSITSYFHVSSFDDLHNLSNKPPHTTSMNETSFPALPSTVQSSLINVGMRVRKSVSEGYKTGTYSAFNLFSDAPSYQAATKIPSKTRPRAGARELTPFCGILKVGDMAQQQWSIWDPSGSNQADDHSIYIEETIEGNNTTFLSSQASTISSASITTPTREHKRRFVEDDEGYGNETGQFSETGHCERVIAVPRRKTLSKKLIVANADASFYVIDFEDAEFLDYNLVGEVDMS